MTQRIPIRASVGKRVGIAVGTTALILGAAVVTTSNPAQAAGTTKTFETTTEHMVNWYGTSVARSTTVAHTGTGSLAVTESAANWGIQESLPPTTTVAAGSAYTFSAWGKAATNTDTVTIQVRWLTSSDQSISLVNVGAATKLSTTGWTNIAGNLTAPANAALVSWNVISSTGKAKAVVYFDDLSVAPVVTPTPTPTTTTPTPTPTTTTPTPTPTTTTPTPTPTTTTPTPTPTTTTTPPTGTVCTNPTFTTSTNGDGVTDGAYYVHNNMWNAQTGTTQSLAVCSYHSWNVTTNATNSGGAVQTYPNVHKDYHNWTTGVEPPLSNYPTMTSTWGSQDPAAGTYDVAYDIWLNGVPGNREIMIWTHNRGQTPAGSIVASGLTFPGSYTGTWDLWATSGNGYLAFVPSGGTVLPSGSINLRSVFDYLTANGRIPSNSTLGQIDYGVEVVSSGGAPATWNFTDFSITDTATGPTPTPTTTTPSPTPTTTTPTPTPTTTTTTPPPHTYTCTVALGGTCGAYVNPAVWPGSNGYNTYVTNQNVGSNTGTTESLSANSGSDWQVTANATPYGYGGVQTFPDTQQLFNNWCGSLTNFDSCASPTDTPLASLPGLKIRYAETSPVGNTNDHYEFAPDLWLGNYPQDIMFWTDTQGRCDAGSYGSTILGHAVINGQNWTVHRYGGAGAEIIFVLDGAGGSGTCAQQPSGTIDIAAGVAWLNAQGIVTGTNTVNQLNTGWEITSAQNSTYRLTDYAILPQ